MLEKIEDWFKLKKFMLKCGVKRNATQEEINDAVIKWLKNHPNKHNSLVLTESQRQDPEFMLRLYNTDNLTGLYTYQPTGELAQNKDFMVNFFKFINDYELAQHSYYHWNLEHAMDRYRGLFTDMDFVKKLSQEVPNINLVEGLKHLKGNNLYYKTTISNIEDYPEEMLIEQCRRFGKDAVSCFSSKCENIEKYVSAGIEKDGFKSLEYLPYEKIIPNKNLVVKAYNVDGIDGLAGYIRDFLKPGQYYTYMCHGEPHSGYEYSKVREKVQEDLLSTREIGEILEANNVVPRKQVKVEVSYSLK